MKEIKLKELFYTNEGILSLWQAENFSLAPNHLNNFLQSTEVAELVKRIKPVVLQAFIKNQEAHKRSTSLSTSRELKVWPATSRLWQKGDRTWILEDSDSWSLISHKKFLLIEWEKRYGALSVIMKSAFLKREELMAVIDYPKSLVIEELNNHKKLSELLVGLQDRGNAVDWLIEVEHAELLFSALYTRFEKQSSRTSSGDNMYSCNACGMRLPLFNNHEC